MSETNRLTPRRQAWEPPEADLLPPGFEPGPVPPELRHQRFPELAPGPMQGFWRPVATTRGWLCACPCCWHAWVAVVPDEETGFAPFPPPGCSGSCDERDVIEWHAFRCGVILPELQLARTERSRAYCRAALIKACERVARDPRAVNREAFSIGRLLPAAKVSARAAAHALANAAGTDPAVLLPHVEAGTTRPWRR